MSKIYLNTCECGNEIKVKFGKSLSTTAICRVCGNKYGYKRNKETQKVNRILISYGNKDE